MRKLNFFYADLKKFPFDRARLLNEITPYLKTSLETGPSEKYKKLYAPNIDITYFREDQKIINGQVKGYSVLSLTESDLKYSTFGFNSLRENMINYKWSWKKNLEYTKYVIDQLPFLNYFIVKLIYLPKDGIGVLHRDTEKFVNHAITLELTPATNLMKFYYNDKVFESTSDYFIFDDTLLHGAGLADSDRIILRIFGELDFDKMNDSIINESIRYF
jgi:hypothetical protein